MGGHVKLTAYRVDLLMEHNIGRCKRTDEKGKKGSWTWKLKVTQMLCSIISMRCHH